jgi:hypothetical protein
MPVYPTVMLCTYVGRAPAYTFKRRETGEVVDAGERLKFVFKHEDGTPEITEFGVGDFDKAGATFDALSLAEGAQVRLVGEVRVPSRDAAAERKAYVVLRQATLVDAPTDGPEAAANGRAKTAVAR